MSEGLGHGQGGGMGTTNFPPPAPFHLGSRQFSLKYFLKSCTFTENLFVNFYICHFHFLSFFFSPLFTGSLREEGGKGGRWTEFGTPGRKEGGRCMGGGKKGREEKVKKSGGNRD